MARLAPLRRRRRAGPSANGRALRHCSGTASRRVIDYFRCSHRLTVDNLAHYARIVKEESGGRLPTLAFYGYTPDWNWTVECDHRDIYRALCLKDLDMLSAPHSYCRRKLGEDGLFRCFVDSNILHGKYFIDEGDDRTHLVYRDRKSDDPRVPRTPEDTDALLWRQFGQAVTHGVGLWYMDIIRYQYRDPAILKTIAEVRKVSERSLSYDRTHISQVALVTNPESEFYMAYRQTDGNRVSIVCYGDQIGEFCRAGAPFDWYIADDLGAVVERKYRVVVFVGCEYLTEKQAALVERLKSDGRALVFVHATGYVSENALSRPRIERICGQAMKPGTVRGLLFEMDSGRFFGAGEHQDGLFLPDGGETIACGFGELSKTPVVTRRAHDGWTSVFASIPRLDAAMLRTIYRDAGVHVYTDEDVVLSANRNWLMLHTNHAGDYDVRLPRTCRRVTDVTTGRTVATDADRFVHPMGRFRTAVFLMED
ncbi:MAG: hypothetical protein IJG13_17740 [Kiritimatiellae bacterium]|nr:hypothetical protein [Kiritimatiellia bacterium]